MNIQEIIFSPTGGTKRVADIVSDELGRQSKLEKKITDLTDCSFSFSDLTFQADDIAIIAVPSYGGRVPAVCSERIHKLNGDGAQAVLICVYGNRAYEDTLAELADLAAEAGFAVTAAIAAVAEHSIVRKFAAGRPDEEDRKKLESFAFQIMNKIKTVETPGEAQLKVPGNRPYKKTSAGGMVPKAGSGCTKCGLCAEKCPAGAIDKENPQTVDTKKCISCMRCVSVCPVSARKLNPAMLLAVQTALKKSCAKRKENELFL